MSNAISSGERQRWRRTPSRRAAPSPQAKSYPDAWLDELEATPGDPVAEYDQRESVQLGFLAAVQLLPPSQRAVLLLRDVVGFSAAEVAELLDVTTASVNGALLRARSRIEQERGAGRLQSGRIVPSDERGYLSNPAVGGRHKLTFTQPHQLYPPADVTVERIRDLLRLDLARLVR
jgi:RNA polymerase sigma-70 factor (ECF subfamily)